MDVNNNVALKVNNISKSYGKNIILKDVSFSVFTGDIVGIIGPNGSGKSTLAKIILGFDLDHKGEVVFSDDVRIAYVPQFSNSSKYALPLSVYEFICSTANSYYGSKERININKIVKTLQHVGLDERYLEQNVYSLSGGERQRVFIARALLNNPNFILLDEPLASVDYMSRNELYALLRHLNQTHNITMMMISHDIDSIVDISDSVFCLDELAIKKYAKKDFKIDTKKIKNICKI